MLRRGQKKKKQTNISHTHSHTNLLKNVYEYVLTSLYACVYKDEFTFTEGNEKKKHI